MPTNIEWCDETWNPVTGCTNISPGCDFCYAEVITNRFKRHPWSQVTLHPDRLNFPSKLKKPSKIFLCSMGDLFHSDVSWEFILEVFEVMALNPQHTFQVLTKRPGRMLHFAEHKWCHGQTSDGPDWYRNWPSNVWAGTSVETQKYAPRLDLLAKIPAKVRFVSYEPALGPVDFSPWLGCSLCRPSASFPDGIPWGAHCGGCSKQIGSDGLDWTIAGGESGPSARPADPDWFRDVAAQCKSAAVPFFMKQLLDQGKKVPYRAFPTDLQIREFPDA